MPDSICDIDKSEAFDRRAHQYSDGLRDVPGVNLNSHVKGVKRLLMAEAGTKPGPCAALGAKEKATSGHQALGTYYAILVGPQEHSKDKSLVC